MSHEDEEERLRKEGRDAAKAALTQTWNVERHDQEGGSIRYEVWSSESYHRICSISDDDNITAKRDAEHIAKLHNDALDAPLAKLPRCVGVGRAAGNIRVTMATFERALTDDEMRVLHDALRVRGGKS